MMKYVTLRYFFTLALALGLLLAGSCKSSSDKTMTRETQQEDQPLQVSQANPAYFHGPQKITHQQTGKYFIGYSYDKEVEFGSREWGDALMTGLTMAAAEAREDFILGIYMEIQGKRVLYSIPCQVFKNYSQEKISMDDFIDALEMTEEPD